jgi:RNA 2',3'-cyclic 3'-phosphodiesterase
MTPPYVPSDPMRLFIALELPQEAREALLGLQQRLRSRDSAHAVRWLAAETFHLTLKFLGDTPSNRVTEIESALARAVKGHGPFELGLVGQNQTERISSLQVIWAACTGDNQALWNLRAIIEEQVAPLGFPTESRPFNPHFTLGRARKDATRDKLLALWEYLRHEKSVLARWQVEGVSLMNSDLQPTGAVYSRLAYQPLSTD